MAKRRKTSARRGKKRSITISIDLSALDKLYKKRYEVSLDGGDTKGGSVKIHDGDTKGGVRIHDGKADVAIDEGMPISPGRRTYGRHGPPCDDPGPRVKTTEE